MDLDIHSRLLHWENQRQKGEEIAEIFCNIYPNYKYILVSVFLFWMHFYWHLSLFLSVGSFSFALYNLFQQILTKVCWVGNFFCFQMKRCLMDKWLHFWKIYVHDKYKIKFFSSSSPSPFCSPCSLVFYIRMGIRKQSDNRNRISSESVKWMK